MTNLLTRASIVIFGMVAVSMLGCGGDEFSLAPVNGVVMMDGKPAANVAVMFTPLETSETSIVGPFSTAVTDAEGKFTLKTKQGKLGAVIGKHEVSCQYADFDPEAGESIMESLQEAQASGDDTSALKAKLKALKNKKGIPEKYSAMAQTVEKEGLVDHKIELKSK